MKIVLLGDYDENLIAHRAIPAALKLSSLALGSAVEPVWIHSSEFEQSALSAADGLWCVPFSPVAEPEAVIGAIRQARESGLPFLGTCAGYQHALLEYARNVLGFGHADSSENNPSSSMPLISALGCELRDRAETVRLRRGSRLEGIYQSERVNEVYNCAFGINPDYLSIFDGSALEFSAYDEDGAPRAFELCGHRYFFGTAYQPERVALQRAIHPLVTAFLMAAS